MKCSCEGWKESYPKVEAITMYAHVHGMNYEGDEFQFCPWCGLGGGLTTRAADVSDVAVECGDTPDVWGYDGDG